MAQLYGTMAVYTRRRASVLVLIMFVMCLRAYVCRFDKADGTPTSSDTAITDRYSDTNIFQLRVHWVRISLSIGPEKSFGYVPPVGVEMEVANLLAVYTKRSHDVKMTPYRRRCDTIKSTPCAYWDTTISYT